MEARRRLIEGAVFEVIPLKHARRQAGVLPVGSFVSVTASPARGMDATIELTEQLTEDGYRVIPHMSARLTKSRTELKDNMRRLEAAGVTRVFIVGGDDEDPGEFVDAMALIRAISEMDHPFTEIGITGYPEGHPFIEDDQLVAALLDKQRYASYITTQMCFDTDRISSWIRDRRATGVHLPIVVGIPGVVDTVKLLTIGARIGVGTSIKFLTKNRRSVTKLIKPGRFTPDELMQGLVPLAADPTMDLIGVHVFTFNQVEATLQWLDELSTTW